MRNFPLAKGHLPKTFWSPLCQYTSGTGNLWGGFIENWDWRSPYSPREKGGMFVFCLLLFTLKIDFIFYFEKVGISYIHFPFFYFSNVFKKKRLDINSQCGMWNLKGSILFLCCYSFKRFWTCSMSAVEIGFLCIL